MALNSSSITYMKRPGEKRVQGLPTRASERKGMKWVDYKQYLSSLTCPSGTEVVSLG